jgi:hypothetical protein
LAAAIIGAERAWSSVKNRLARSVSIESAMARALALLAVESRGSDARTGAACVDE